jgi:hypothetical protein
MADRLGMLLEQLDELTPPAWMFSDPDRVDGSHDLREFMGTRQLPGSSRGAGARAIDSGCAKVHRRSWRYLSQCWKAQECAIALRAWKDST